MDIGVLCDSTLFCFFLVHLSRRGFGPICAWRVVRLQLTDLFTRLQPSPKQCQRTCAGFSQPPNQIRVNEVNHAEYKTIYIIFLEAVNTFLEWVVWVLFHCFLPIYTLEHLFKWNWQHVGFQPVLLGHLVHAL